MAMTTGFYAREADAVDLIYERGWTDGLPVVPPTEARVTAMLEAVSLDFEDVLGVVSERSRAITAGKLAVNAVMAGALPEHFGVILAAVRALLNPSVNLNAMTTSTGGPAPLLIVSGAVGDRIGMNSGGNALGPGNRANICIGRTIRLLILNVLGSTPGLLDGATLGHPGKLSYAFAESDPPDSWGTLREDLGYPAHWSVVVAVGAEAPRQVSNAINPDPRAILTTIAAAIACPANNIAGHPTAIGGECVVVLGPEHADSIRHAGWSRSDVREFLYENTILTRRELREAGRLLDDDADEADRLPTLTGPEGLLLVTAGGYGGRWSAVIPAWAPVNTTKHATHPLEQTIPDEELACDIDGSCTLFEE